MISASAVRVKQVARVETADDRWRGLYRAGGAAALITVALTAAAIVAYIAWPPPDWSAGSAIHWFARFQDNWLLGLLGLDLMIAVSLVLGVPFFLALYVALRRAGESAMAVATALALLGTVLHLVSNTAFEMLSLSQGYAAATTEAQRAVFLAAGEAALASYNGTAFHVSYVLGYAAKIAIGFVMLRSAAFGKGTAYTGILAGVAGFGFYLPALGMLLSILSVLVIAVWNVLVARALFRLARGVSPAERMVDHGRA
ncbi:MAG: hypothetical protein M0Z94_07660 [Dehalococcoidales bacterium]|nr:hypothetical protein [Dehalococcoidales bacterium]